LAARISKRQMKQDPFIEYVLRAWEYITGHQQMVFIGLVVVLVAAALVGWGMHSRKQARINASSQFADALSAYRTGDLKTADELFKMVVKDYGSTENGVFAEYFVGKCALDSGRYLDAIQAFDKYLGAGARYPFFHDAAMEGKAVAYEDQHQYKEAGQAYLDLAKSLKTNAFMETTYLRRAGEAFRLAGETQRAIEILGPLVDKSTGTERRDLEIELEILKG
jgi:tetratricopeptide (TPR) repeat protein